MHANQTGAVCWITGLSGAGKTTLAVALERRLNALGVKAIVLDGDDLRSSPSKTIAFTPRALSRLSRATANVVFPAPERPVIQHTAPVWFACIRSPFCSIQA